MNTRPEARTVAQGAVMPVPSIAEWRARQAEVMARQDRIRADVLEQIEANKLRGDMRARTAFDTLERIGQELGNEADRARITPAEVALIVVAAIVGAVGIVNTIINWGVYAAQW